MYPQDRASEKSIPSYVPPEASAALIEYRITRVEERMAGVEKEIRNHADEFNAYKLDVLGKQGMTLQNLLLGPIVTTALGSIVTWLILRIVSPPGGHP